MSPPASPCLDGMDRFDRMDPTRLAEHCRECAQARGRLHRFFCAVEAMNAFAAPRFVTLVALASLVFIVVLSASSL